MKFPKRGYLLLSNSLKWNSIANFIGRLWSAILSLISVPLFINILGTEAFGLLGLFASLQIVLNFLDFGLSATIQREIAKNLARNVPQSDNHNLLRTFEIIYWIIGLIIGGLVLFLSGWIARNWLNVQQLSASDVFFAFFVLTLSLVIRWPISLYTGVLLGMQRQILVNIILIFTSSLRTLGSLAVIYFISPSLKAFLLAQFFASIIELLLTVIIAWNSLGRNRVKKPVFQFEILKNVWRFALSFNIVGVLGTILSQSDRLVIGRYLPLDQLGYYSIANTAAGAMPLISNSVSVAIFPRFSSQAVLDEKENLRRNFHNAQQVISFPTTGLAFIIFFYSREIISIWIRTPLIVDESWKALTILSIAFLLNSILNPAYTMLIAFGYIRIPLIVNFVNLCFFLPLMVLLIPKWGIVAAASIWLSQNLIAFIAYVYFSNKKILQEILLNTVSRDFLIYLTMGLFWFGGGKLFFQMSLKSPLASFFIILLSGIGYIISIFYLSKYFRLFPYTFLKRTMWVASSS